MKFKMNPNPKLKIEADDFDKKLELLGYFLLFFLWVYSVYAYTVLPDIIPTHFNIKGEVDSFGGKMMVLFLPLVGTIMYVSLTFLNKYPHYFNYPSKITPENAFAKYTVATKMMRVLKNELLFIFSIIQIFTYLSVKGETSSLIFWFLPFVIIMMLATMIYFIVKLTKAK